MWTTLFSFVVGFVLFWVALPNLFFFVVAGREKHPVWHTITVSALICGVVSWIGWSFCCKTKQVETICGHANKQDRKLPKEYFDFKESFERLQGEINCKSNMYLSVFDFPRITNATWIADAKSIIRESSVAYERINDMCLDAKVSLAQQIENNSDIECAIDGLYFSDNTLWLCVCSYENMHKVERLYTLLDRYRSHWKIEDDVFVFDNEHVDDECSALLREIEFP